MIHFKCKGQETNPEQKKTHERIVNHCFTCKIKSRNKLTVADMTDTSGKSNSRKPIS